MTQQINELKFESIGLTIHLDNKQFSKFMKQIKNKSEKVVSKEFNESYERIHLKIGTTTIVVFSRGIKLGE